MCDQNHQRRVELGPRLSSALVQIKLPHLSPHSHKQDGVNVKGKASKCREGHKQKARLGVSSSPSPCRGQPASTVPFLGRCGCPGAGQKRLEGPNPSTQVARNEDDALPRTPRT